LVLKKSLESIDKKDLTIIFDFHGKDLEKLHESIQNLEQSS